MKSIFLEGNFVLPRYVLVFVPQLSERMPGNGNPFLFNINQNFLLLLGDNCYLLELHSDINYNCTLLPSSRKNGIDLCLYYAVTTLGTVH